jgi:aldehyde:ferredoxin oxidoreductase
MAGIPPQSSGPLEGITVDIDTLTREYREAMEWDPLTGKPTDACLAQLGLQEFVKKYV